MEETVWLYFGIITVIVALAGITSIIMTYKDSSEKQQFFTGLQQLSGQAEQVCASPKDTMLSSPITIPAGGMLFAQEDRICGQFGDTIRCRPTRCAITSGTLVNLTNETLFDSHEYLCTVLKDGNLTITCAG